MAATDLVPCFYTGQDYRWEKPAKVLLRSEVRELKKAKIGYFVENGKIFLFFNAMLHAAKKVWDEVRDGPLGRGNILPFARLHNHGDKLHYEVPMAGDRSVYARHRRKLIHPSSRSLFNHQILPARVAS